MITLALLSKFVRKYLLSREAIVLYIILIVMWHFLLYIKVFEYFKPFNFISSLTHVSFVQNMMMNRAINANDTRTLFLEEANVAVFSMQGRRVYMEDEFDVVTDSKFTKTSLYAVYDGHGGKVSSEFVKRILLKSILLDITKAHKDHSTVDLAHILTYRILDTDSKLMNLTRQIDDISGTTCLVALIKGDYLTVANVGDSRAVMCDEAGIVHPLSVDHKPNQPMEKQRVENAGGFVSMFGVWRVMGILAMSRTLGDHQLKRYIIADPDILSFNIRDQCIKFMILASDGLWDVFTNQEAVDFIAKRLNEPFYGAKSLVLAAYKRGSLDNITVMVVRLDHVCRM